MLDLEEAYCNKGLVNLEPVADPKEQAKLRSILETHKDMTGSPLAEELLKTWETSVKRFTRVIPRDYEAMLQLIRKYEGSGCDHKEAVERAFEEKIG